MLSGTVSAGLGFNAATVPFCTLDLLERLLLRCWWVVEIVRFRESSDSIFLRIACEGFVSALALTVLDAVRRLGMKLIGVECARGGVEGGVAISCCLQKQNLRAIDTVGILRTMDGEHV